jgi:hypothetical protein
LRYQFLHRRTSPIALAGPVIALSLARGEHLRHLLLPAMDAEFRRSESAVEESESAVEEVLASWFGAYGC